MNIFGTAQLCKIDILRKCSIIKNSDLGKFLKDGDWHDVLDNDTGLHSYSALTTAAKKRIIHKFSPEQILNIEIYCHHCINTKGLLTIRDATFGHILAKMYNGKYHPSNLVPEHEECNHSHGSADLYASSQHYHSKRRL